MSNYLAQHSFATVSNVNDLRISTYNLLMLDDYQ